MFRGIEGPLLLLVLDGVGESGNNEGNAVTMADTPSWDFLRRKHRFTSLLAHGRAVGLPSDKDMGNSEVGHNALGSGQVFDQGAKLVEEAIATGELFRGQAWRTATDRAMRPGATLHLLGLLSDGNVHSHCRHLYALLRQAAAQGLKRVRVHVLLDGRDVAAVSAHRYLEELERLLTELNQAGRDYRIASGGGRMKLTMDRYGADWDMVAAGWRHHVQGAGRGFASALEALAALRREAEGIGDQDLPGFVVVDADGPVGPVRDGDSLLLFNFRGDRAIEISRAFDDAVFPYFERGGAGGRGPDVFYAGMMEYDGDIRSPANYLVGPPSISGTLSQLLVEKKLRQYAISETQKFGHITYFWNGNHSGLSSPEYETFVEIRSDNVPFEQRPWMKAAEITDALIAALASGSHHFLRANYANGDMVGHTGDLRAAMAAMVCLDLQLGRLMKAVERAGGVAIFTADHGNCDEMFELDSNGHPLMSGGVVQPKTSHTLNRVPFVLYDPHGQVPGSLHHGIDLGVASVAATVAEILGVAAPAIWQTSLLIH